MDIIVDVHIHQGTAGKAEMVSLRHTFFALQTHSRAVTYSAGSSINAASA